MDTGESISIYMFLIILCVLFSGFFSSSETVLTSLGNLRIRKLISDNEKYSKLFQLWVDNPNGIFNTILLGNALAIVGATMLTVQMTWKYYDALYRVVVIGGITAILLITGEAIPKTIARYNAERLVIAHMYLLRVFYYSFYPFTMIINFIVKLVIKMLGDKTATGQTITEEDISYILDVSEEQGVLEESTQQMISGILDISDTQVKEVMVPRTDMIAISIDITKEEFLKVIERHEHSRLPVYDDTLDNIKGILYIKDLMKLISSDWSMNDYMSTMHDALFVPETKRVDDMLKDFQHSRQQMAIVVDEYGGVAGVVTMEDILEEIVGDIWDEYDDGSEQEITPIDTNKFIVDTRTNIYDLYEYFSIKINEETQDFDTVGGLIYAIAGAIPSEGDRYQWRDFEILIRKMSSNRLEEVEFIRLLDDDALRNEKN